MLINSRAMKEKQTKEELENELSHEEVEVNREDIQGFPKDVDLKKFLGCGG